MKKHLKSLFAAVSALILLTSCTIKDTEEITETEMAEASETTRITETEIIA